MLFQCLFGNKNQYKLFIDEDIIVCDNEIKRIDYNNGRKKYVEYKLVDGTIKICYFNKLENLIREEYKKDNLLHRKYEPAVIEYVNGYIKRVEYWENNVLIKFISM